MKKQSRIELDSVKGTIGSYLHRNHPDRTSSPISVLNEWKERKPNKYKKYESVIIENAPELLMYIERILHKPLQTRGGKRI